MIAIEAMDNSKLHSGFLSYATHDKVRADAVPATCSPRQNPRRHHDRLVPEIQRAWQARHTSHPSHYRHHHPSVLR